MKPVIHEFLLRLRALLLRRRLDRELQEELEFHQSMLREKLRHEGAEPGEAEDGTRRAFGDARRWQERLREMWQFERLESLARDAAFSARLLRRSPAFAAVALGTLGLAVAATTAVFSLIDGLLLRPLPVPHADQLVMLNYSRSDNPALSYGFSAPLLRGLERRHDLLTGVAGFSSTALQARNQSGVVEIPGSFVSGEFFSTLEAPPLLGRYLTPQDDREGREFAAVISQSFWQKWFGGAPNVVGRTLMLSGAPFTVVGVMPKGFFGADPTERPDIYIPFSTEPVVDAPFNNIAGGIHNWWIEIIGRRSPGVSIQQLNEALSAVSGSIVRSSVSDEGWVKDAAAHQFRFQAEPGSRGYSWLRRLFSKPLIAVFCLCAAMLLLACLNLASLLLARSAARGRELATRLAIGASRQRLIQQLLVESLLIASLGTAIGLAVSPLVSRALAALLMPNAVHPTLNAGVDFRMAWFAVGVAGTAALLIGLIPALRATSNSLSEQMKEGAHGSRARGKLLPAMLLGTEVALALMLMMGAGLLAESLVRLYRTGLGFQPAGVVNLTLSMEKQARDGDALTRWYREFGEALGRLPGAQSVSFEAIMPLSGSFMTSTLRSAAHSPSEGIYMNTVGPDYFRTMGIPVLRGREFRWSDTRTAPPVIVLSQSAAKLLFPGQEAIGQQVQDWNKKACEVVAVVRDIHYTSVQAPPPPEAYTSITQDEGKKPSYTAIVRVRGSAAPMAAAARTLVERMAPDIPPPVLTTMSGELNASIGSERMMATLAGFFAACALLVTAIGLYGTLAYATARRTTEIGIRMALGAQRRQVVGLVIRDNAMVAASGSLAGLIVALLASRALASFLYGTSVRDPWVMGGSVVALTVVSAAASMIPAIRAAWIEPVLAIRCE